MELKDILGKPNEGIHSSRIGPFASVDMFLTLIAAIGMAILFNRSVVYMFIILFILAQIFHIAFGVETAFIKMLNKPIVQDFLFSGLIGYLIGVGCGINPFISMGITLIINLLVNRFIFDKIIKKITKFIMTNR